MQDRGRRLIGTAIAGSGCHRDAGNRVRNRTALAGGDDSEDSAHLAGHAPEPGILHCTWLTAGTTYTVQVRVIGAARPSEWSEVASAMSL